jgi:NagD protein
VTPDLKDRIRNAPGFIFDMDGTIALGDASSGGHKALPGAVELLALLRKRGTPFRVFTNGSGKPPTVYAAGLRKAGFDLEDHEMMTPSTSAAIWFASKGIRRVRVLGNEGVGAPLIEKGIEVIGPAEQASGVEAVYTGWFREFTFPDLEAACQSIWDGAILTTASHVPFFAAAGGRAIGASFAINTMITSLTGKRARVLGKPSRVALDAAREAMGLPRRAASAMVVVGDDPALEMRMANRVGAVALATRTGLLDDAGLELLPTHSKPSRLLGNLSELMEILQH